MRRRAWWHPLVLAALLVVGVPGMARAHGALRRSVPASGAHLAAAPRELRLGFSEAVELAVARLALLGPAGDTVALSPVRVGETPAVIVADVTGPLVAGTYTVAWQIAGRDGHPVRGRFRFTIAPGATGLGAAATAAAPADTTDHGAHTAAAAPEAPAPPLGIAVGS